MSMAHTYTQGYGNGTLSGSIALIVRTGYTAKIIGNLGYVLVDAEESLTEAKPVTIGTITGMSISTVATVEALNA